MTEKLTNTDLRELIIRQDEKLQMNGYSEEIAISTMMLKAISSFRTRKFTTKSEEMEFKKAVIKYFNENTLKSILRTQFVKKQADAIHAEFYAIFIKGVPGAGYVNHRNKDNWCFRQNLSPII